MNFKFFTFFVLFSVFASVLATTVNHEEEDEISSEIFGIVGGNTTIKKFPYAVSLTYKGKVIGAGAILNSRYVITAARISSKAPVRNVVVRTSSNQAQKGGCEFSVQKWIPHHLYKGDIQFDLGIIKLNKNISPKKCHTKSVNLAYRTPKDGTKANVVGWGWGTNQGGVDKIAAATVPVLNINVCKSKYYPKYESLTDLSLCTNGKKGPCENDLGAPLVYGKSNVLIGLYSKSFQCATPSMPTIYTDVTNFQQWIENVIKEN